jgi:nucleotide-binding universal stress UspA family protein
MRSKILERVMVPLDGSKHSEAVLPFACELGRDTTVDVVGVNNPLEDLERLLEAYLGKKAAEFQAEGIKARAVILKGSPAEKLIDYSESNNIGLIVMATHGRTGSSRWALGSVADRVLRGGSVPLLLVNTARISRRRARKKPFRNVLLPLDGSQLGEVALPYGLELARRSGTRIWLLRVSQPQHLIIDAGEYLMTNIEAAVQGLEQSALAYLSQVEASLKAPGIKLTSQALTGTPAETILEYAGTKKIDLILMSTHGRGGLSRWMFGSVAARVLRAAEVPVLLIRSSGKQNSPH